MERLVNAEYDMDAPPDGEREADGEPVDEDVAEGLAETRVDFVGDSEPLGDADAEATVDAHQVA